MMELHFLKIDEFEGVHKDTLFFLHVDVSKLLDDLLSVHENPHPEQIFILIHEPGTIVLFIRIPSA